jgi:Flp pilus assembly protein TadD
MYKLNGTLSALTIAGLMVACGVDTQEIRNQKESTPPVSEATPVTMTEVVNTTSPTAEPKLTNVTYGDAEAVFRRGQYKDAAELFASVAKSKPGSMSAHYMLGLSAWKSGDHGRAEVALLRAVELDAENVKVRTNLARVLLEQGRPADALPHIDKAIELKPESHEVWRVLGNVRSELGHGAEALAAYREALIINDQDTWSMNNYGLLLIKLGRYEEAVGPLARAVELKSGSPVFQNNLGVALERSEQLEGARQAFRAAVDADSTYVRAKVSLERVQTRLGDRQEDAPELNTLAHGFTEEIARWRRPGSNED